MAAKAQMAERRWLGLAVLSLAQLVIGIDLLVMLIALPSIELDLDMSTETGQWVLTSYALPFGALLLLGGRIADYGGRKRAFLIGAVGFAVASTVGGLAQNAETLLAARALQGASAAVLVPAALSLINVMFTEPRERSRALGVYGAVASSGVALGMVFGGVIAEYISWRWCLLVNPPVMAVAFVGALALLPESRVEGRPRYDVPGAIFGSLALGALVYGFARAGTDGWGDPITIASLIGAGVLGAVFLAVESRVDQPLLPLRLIASPTRTGALLAIMLQFVAFIGLFLYLTYYLQGIEGNTAVRSGMMLLPYALSAMAFAVVFEQPLGRLPRRIPIVAALAVTMVVAVWLGFLDRDWGYATHILPAIVFFGATMVCIFIAVSAAVLDDAPQDDSGVCSALFNVAQWIGFALGAPLLTTIAVQVTDNSADGAVPGPDDLIAGYNAGAFAIAGILLIGIITSLILIRSRPKTSPPEPVQRDRALPAS